jgi:hypothetical protein
MPPRTADLLPRFQALQMPPVPLDRRPRPPTYRRHCVGIKLREMCRPVTDALKHGRKGCVAIIGDGKSINTISRHRIASVEVHICQQAASHRLFHPSRHLETSLTGTRCLPRYHCAFRPTRSPSPPRPPQPRSSEPCTPTTATASLMTSTSSSPKSPSASASRTALHFLGMMSLSTICGSWRTRGQKLFGLRTGGGHLQRSWLVRPLVPRSLNVAMRY